MLERLDLINPDLCSIFSADTGPSTAAAIRLVEAENVLDLHTAIDEACHRMVEIWVCVRRLAPKHRYELEFAVGQGSCWKGAIVVVPRQVRVGGGPDVVVGSVA